MWDLRLENTLSLWPCVCVCLWNEIIIRKYAPEWNTVPERAAPLKLFRIIFCLASTRKALAHTLKDYLHKICGFLIIHEIIPRLCMFFVPSHGVDGIIINSQHQLLRLLVWNHPLSNHLTRPLSLSKVRVVMNSADLALSIHPTCPPPRFQRWVFLPPLPGQLTGLITDLISIKRKREREKRNFDSLSWSLKIFA